VKVDESDGFSAVDYVLIIIFSTIGLFAVVVIIYLIRCWVAKCRDRAAQYELNLAHEKQLQDFEKISPEIRFKNYLNKFRQTDCSICLNAFQETDTIRVLECGHIFHSQCVLEWIKHKFSATCPICNVKLFDKRLGIGNSDINLINDRRVFRAESADW